MHDLKEQKKNITEINFRDVIRTLIKETCNNINSILAKHKIKNKISLIEVDGERVNDAKLISDHFCEYFSSIAGKLDADIPTTQTDPMTYMPDRTDNTFTSNPASDAEIVAIISSLKKKYINAIPIFIYKILSGIIAPVICNIFDRAIEQGSFPTILKLSRVIPIDKCKCKKVIMNYRPISKVIEKLIKTRCEIFLTDNNLLYRHQYGFRSGRNTTDAILQLTDYCTDAFYNRLFTIVIFLDYSKAFDTVNKDIMLRKLDRLVFRGRSLDFFDSYLSDRRLFVELNGQRSETKTSDIGLPQGAISYPWMFGLYINDMHRASNHFKFIHIADDTTIYMSDSDLTRLTDRVNVELRKIYEWLKANRLSLNIEKLTT